MIIHDFKTPTNSLLTGFTMILEKLKFTKSYEYLQRQMLSYKEELDQLRTESKLKDASSPNNSE